MQAMCGVMSTCGQPDGAPGASPMRNVVPLCPHLVRLSAAPVQHRAPPMLGQHSAEVLQELLGKSAAELAQLKSAGVI